MNGAKTLCHPAYRQRLREEISHAPDAANVLCSKLASSNPILEPMKAHVAGLGHLRLDGLVGQAHGDLIVTMNCRGGPEVPEVRQHLALEVRDLRGCKRAPVLGLLYGGTDDGNASGVDGDGGIEKGGVVGASEVVERPSHVASVGPRQERGVCEDVEGHGGGAENLHAVAVGRHESQEAFQVGHGVKGGRGLGRPPTRPRPPPLPKRKSSR
jgi:hypothetical protein